MTDQTVETKLALLEQWHSAIETHLKNTDTQIQALQDERTNALKWGVITLGAAVISLLTWAGSYITGCPK